MSIHAPGEIQVDAKDGYRAVCHCGWKQPQWTMDFDEVFAAYRGHVEEALGPDAYYRAGVACRNCGAEDVQSVLIGIPVGDTTNRCATCGTASLVPCNDVHRDHSWGRSGF